MKKIEIWSDFACPFCYIGHKTLEKAIKELGLENKFEIEMRSFQLNTNAKRVDDKDINQLISEKYNISYDKAKENNDYIVKKASEIGLNFDFENIIPGNTEKAHELLKFGKVKNKGAEITEVLFSAYFEKGKYIGDIEVLSNLAMKVGLDYDEVKKILENNRFRDEVIRDQNQAHKNEIRSVPYFIIDKEYSFTGAMGINEFKKILKSMI